MHKYATKPYKFISKVSIDCGQHDTRCSLNEMQGLSFHWKKLKFRWQILERIICMKYCRTTRKLLGQDMMNPKRTTQRRFMQQRNVFHSMVGIVASGYMLTGSDIRPVARKFPIGGSALLRGNFAFVRKGLTFIKLTKAPLIYSVSCFKLGGLELCWAEPTKAPCGDRTEWYKSLKFEMHSKSLSAQHTYFVISDFLQFQRENWKKHLLVANQLWWLCVKVVSLDHYYRATESQ